LANKISTNPDKIRKGNKVVMKGSGNSKFAKVLSVYKGYARLDNELLGFHSWPVSFLKRITNVKKK